jgi:hypothetical protein
MDTISKHDAKNWAILKTAAKELDGTVFGEGWRAGVTQNGDVIIQSLGALGSPAFSAKIVGNEMTISHDRVLKLFRTNIDGVVLSGPRVGDLGKLIRENIERQSYECVFGCMEFKHVNGLNEATRILSNEILWYPQEYSVVLRK